MTISAPFLSSFDTGATAEGSIDPLSLAPTYDRLANRLLPHLTVRMKRPRFAMAIAAGALICEDLLDAVASDGRTPAWLVFEWYVVEAFIRNLQKAGDTEAWGIPGSQKVSRAIRFGRRLGADAYLKTPTVFGFTGVYLRLARGLQIVDDDMRLDEGGYELLRVWEEEQQLAGFRTATTGAGAELRGECKTAITDGLKKGYTCRPPSWQPWTTLFSCLRPDTPGARERTLLAGRLSHPKTDSETARVAEELFKALQRHGSAIAREEEAGFFRSLLPNASEELKARLELVDAYEAVARLLTDAFDLLRHLSTKAACAPIGASDFSKSSLAQHIVSSLPAALDRIETLFVGDQLGPDVTPLLLRYRHLDTTSQLFDEIVRHHEDAQRAKPPDGKRPWVERMDGVAVRPQYAVDGEPSGDDVYVHDYRTASACSFLQDLGRLPR